MSLQDIVVGKGAIESDCVILGEGLVDSVEVWREGSGGCWGQFEGAKMGMKSPNSSSCVLLLGSALFVGVNDCDVGGSGRVSEVFGVVVGVLEPMVMNVQLKLNREVARF